MAHLVPPFVAGMEFSGRVHVVGQGVTLVLGQPVVGVVNPRRPEGGAHAEFVAVPAGQVAVLPEGIDFTGAATVPMNAVTAMQALEIAGLKPGQVLLSRSPKVLQQLSEPEVFGGHAGLATRLLRRQRQNPGRGISG